MLEPQATRFGQAALQGGLVDPQDLRACWESIPPEKRTPDAADRRLARKVVEAGHLTLWQAQRLIDGIKPDGLRFDRYIILDIIGQGGMGRVYLAKDTRLGRRIALKVLSRERMSNPRALARFQREARVGAQLQHENLVRIYDEGQAHGHRFLVMEYIEGKTVGKIVVERGPLPTAIAARIAREVALGLEHAFQKGLIHRDVNPMNILVDTQGVAKLADLGLAIDLGDAGDVVTRDGATVGTFDYISPEQARSSRSVDIRSDIYSLGCTLYFMLVGRVPFPQPSLPEKLYAHQLLQPDPINSLVAGVPETFVAIVRRMMEKKPEDRFATPADVANALEPFQSGPIPLAQIEAAGEPLRLDTAAVGGNGVPDVPRVDEEGRSDPFGIPIITPAQNESGQGRAGQHAASSLPLIDFGPEPALSDSLSTVRQLNSHEGRIRLWIGAGAAIALTLLVGLALSGSGLAKWGRRATATGTSPVVPAAPGESTDVVPRAGVADIAVRWLDDGSEQPQKDLQEAIRQVVGKRAEIILRNSKGLEIAPDKPLVISGGEVVLRAAEGARPVVAVRLSGTVPFLNVNSNGRLRMIGLTFECEGSGKGPAGSGAPTLIETAGDLHLERCLFTTAGADRGVCVATAEGMACRVVGCQFSGFDQPLRIRSFPASTIEVRQSLFVRLKPGDAKAGWAIAVSLASMGRSGEASHRLLVERCTSLGAGLLAIDGFSPEEPIAVEARGNVVLGEALLMWRGGEIAKSLQWKGGDNRYAISGASWVVQGPEGFNAIPKGPTDLGTWAGLIGGTEPGSADGPVRLTTEPAGAQAELREPKDFALAGGDAGKVGIAPDAVGPPIGKR